MQGHLLRIAIEQNRFKSVIQQRQIEDPEAAQLIEVRDEVPIEVRDAEPMEARDLETIEFGACQSE
jgi:hypothetical protein